jgi:hypothetical protein
MVFFAVSASLTPGRPMFQKRHWLALTMPVISHSQQQPQKPTGSSQLAAGCFPKFDNFHDPRNNFYDPQRSSFVFRTSQLLLYTIRIGPTTYLGRLEGHYA